MNRRARTPPEEQQRHGDEDRSDDSELEACLRCEVGVPEEARSHVILVVENVCCELEKEESQRCLGKFSRRSHGDGARDDEGDKGETAETQVEPIDLAKDERERLRRLVSFRSQTSRENTHLEPQVEDRIDQRNVHVREPNRRFDAQLEVLWR